MVAGPQQRAQQAVLGRQARGEGQPAPAALQRGEVLLQRGAGRVRRAAVLVAAAQPADAVLLVRGDLVDRRHHRPVAGSAACPAWIARVSKPWAGARRPGVRRLRCCRVSVVAAVRALVALLTRETSLWAVRWSRACSARPPCRADADLPSLGRELPAVETDRHGSPAPPDRPRRRLRCPGGLPRCAAGGCAKAAGTECAGSRRPSTRRPATASCRSTSSTYACRGPTAHSSTRWRRPGASQDWQPVARLLALTGDEWELRWQRVQSLGGRRRRWSWRPPASEQAAARERGCVRAGAVR